MPPAYTTVLKQSSRRLLTGEYLYSAIVELALAYHLNYNIVFPKINACALLMQLVSHLGLPSKSSFFTAQQII